MRAPIGIVIGACAALLHSPHASADCTLAFAPPELRQAASEHYYRSPRRDATPPGRLPSVDRQEVRNPPVGDLRSDDARDNEEAAHRRAWQGGSPAP
jgi:hypothetical protein